MRLAFFQPDIPQNLGAALRLSACLGAILEIIEPCGFPLDDKKLRRVALDYGDPDRIERHQDWQAFLNSPARRQGRLVLFTTQAEQRYDLFSFQAEDTLLFGRESAGVPDHVQKTAEARLYLPLMPQTRSFNLVTAAALGLGEALRQTKAGAFGH